MNHTPGPWERTNLTVHTQATADRPALAIARVFEAGVETEAATSPAQATANANLIAAAPKLLEALEKVLRHEHQAHPLPLGQRLREREEAHAAIAEARGQ